MINTAIVQSCSARYNYIKALGMIFKELSNSFIFLVVSPVASNIPNSFFLQASLRHIHIVYFQCGRVLRKCQIYPVTVHTTRRTRSVTDTQSRHMAYSLVLWTITEFKNVLARWITARRLENTVLYIVLGNMLN